MPYYVNFTNGNRLTTVADQVINNSSSLSFVGKNYTGYGKIIADNFLHLMENFANGTAPLNPVEGQLWYDNTPGVNSLKIFNGSIWNPAGSIKKAITTPALTESVNGDLWVNPNTKQLSMFTGSSWELIGPQFSSGLKTGPLVEVITDITDDEHSVLSIYAQNELVAIISQIAFAPKLTINGFSTINKGINLSTANQTVDSTKFWGTAASADGLVINGSVISSSNFLRSDVVSSTNKSINIRSNDGLSIGTNISFKISADDVSNLVSLTARSGKNVSFDFSNTDQIIAALSASWDTAVVTLTFAPLEQPPFAVGSSINVTRFVPIGYNGTFTVTDSTVSSVSFTLSTNPGAATVIGQIKSTDAVYVSGLFIKSDLTVGIRNPSPTEALDVHGNILSNGKLTITGIADSTSLSTGSIITSGGLAVNKKSNFGDTATFRNSIKFFRTAVTPGEESGPVLIPDYTGLEGAPLYDIGTPTAKFRHVYAETIHGVHSGDITGNVHGNVYGFAATLQTAKLFALTGDVTCDPIPFNGSADVTFQTTVSSSFISSKTLATSSLVTDEILTFRPTTGLQRTTKKLFLSSIPAVLVGSIITYAGIYAPAGYLFCDGSEVYIASYPDLFNTIKYSYRNNAALVGTGTFALPDLRGRFPLGRDDMDNGLTVVTSSNLQVNAGGNRNGLGNVGSDRANRVHHSSATTLGSGSGSEAFGAPSVTGVTGSNVTVNETGNPNSIMNPYQTINYIIFTGVIQ
jgi:microcystin-dependent protein